MKMTEENKNNNSDIPQENNGELSVRHSKTLDLIAKIGCVAVAFFIWLYVMGTESPTYERTFSSIPVEIVNESGLSLLSGDGAYTDITVRGKRSLLNRFSADDFRAYAELNKEENGSAGQYRVSIQYTLPGGVELESSSTSSVTVYLDNTTSMQVPVRVVIGDYMLEEGYELGTSDITTDISTVRVTGPESLLENIDYAKVEVSPGRVTRTVTCSGVPVLIDSSGETLKNNYVKMQTDRVTVTVPVYKYRLMELSASGRYGYFNSSNSSITLDPPAIRIKGEADSVDAASFNYVIDEKQIFEDGTYNVKITLPEGVESADGVDTVAITVKNIGMLTKKVMVTDILVNNPNGLEYEMLTESLGVTVRCPASLISNMTPDNIRAVVDLSGQQEREGNLLLPAVIEISYYGRNSYELGSYSVSIKITGKNST